jgi:alpha-beta hydrolase superfamily lysophospholipase
VAGYAWPAPDARAVLLLQHGLGEYAERYVARYSGLVPRLLEAGVTVHAFDLRGHGRSPGRRTVTDVGRAVEDHLAARRLLRGQPLPVFFLGHSLGGLVTAASDARDPEGVAGVVLSSPLLLVPSGALTRALVRVAAPLVPGLPARRARDPAGVSRLPEEVRAFLADPMIVHGPARMLLGATVLRVTHEGWPRYPAWRAPTLVLHGTADTFTDPEGSRRFFAAVASEDRTLHLVEGGYHELLNDAGREGALGVILAWLERRLPPRRG